MKRKSIIAIALLLALPLLGCDKLKETLDSAQRALKATVVYVDSAAIAAVLSQASSEGPGVWTCPQVTGTAASVSLDFGTSGCQPDHGLIRKTVYGTASATISGNSVNLTLTNVRIGNGPTVSGTIDASVSRGGTTNVNLNSSSLTINWEGITYTVNLSGAAVIDTTGNTLTITGSGSVNDGTSTITATASNVIIPLGSGNGMPNNGTLSVNWSTALGSVNVVVTFLSTTPTDGKVDVSIGGLAAVSYTLPGF